MLKFQGHGKILKSNSMATGFAKFIKMSLTVHLIMKNWHIEKRFEPT